MSGPLDEYQRRLDAWAMQRFDTTVLPGTAKVSVDAAAYASGAWCSIVATWLDDGGAEHRRELADDAWQYEFGAVIREILAIELPPDAEGN